MPSVANRLFTIGAKKFLSLLCVGLNVNTMNLIMRLIDTGFFSFLFPVLLLLAVTTGFYWARKKNKIQKTTGVEGGVISFFALLVSFTLASAGSSMKERLSLVHQQADGISQLYRQSVIAPDSIRSFIHSFLIRHIDIQLENGKISEQGNDRMMDKIGRNNAMFLEQIKEKRLTENTLSSFNLMTSNTYKLIYSYEERIPRIIMVLLILSSLMIGSLVGYLNGASEERHYLGPIIYIVLVVLTIQAIRDLDNPNSGSVKPSYDNLREVKEMIQGSN